MQLCLALDLPTEEENLSILKHIPGYTNTPIWIKVGLRSFIRDGNKIVKKIKSINPSLKIFLDLKLHDIPNTMQDAAQELMELEVDMITLHTSSGSRAMKGVMSRLKEVQQLENKKRPLVLGVSALTSFDEASFKEIYHADILSQTLVLSKMAYECGLDGVVCAVPESLPIKQKTEKTFLTLTPGIRPFPHQKDDQERVCTIQEAKENLSDFIVIGRPVYKAKNIKEAIEEILRQMGSI